MPVNVTQSLAVNILNVYLDAITSARLMLCDATVWSATPSEEEIFLSEISEVNGYARQNVAPTLPAAINATANRAERVLTSASVAATSGTLVYSGYAVVIDGAAIANGSAMATAATNQISLANHGLSNGDRIMITADTGGAVPTGLSGTTFYYASVVDANTITLFTDEGLGTQATFSDDGSSLRLRYAAGVMGLFKNIGTTRTIDATASPHDFTALTMYLS